MRASRRYTRSLGTRARRGYGGHGHATPTSTGRTHRDAVCSLRRRVEATKVSFGEWLPHTVPQVQAGAWSLPPGGVVPQRPWRGCGWRGSGALPVRSWAEPTTGTGARLPARGAGGPAGAALGARVRTEATDPRGQPRVPRPSLTGDCPVGRGTARTQRSRPAGGEAPRATFPGPRARSNRTGDDSGHADAVSLLPM